MRVLTAVCATTLTVAGCSGVHIVNTDDNAPPSLVASPTETSTPRPSNAHLANAFDYAGHPQDQDLAVYYFTTPSGRWACAIVPREKAGCQSTAGGQSAMGITGEPESVPDAAGQPVSPNAIIVDRRNGAQFVALEQPEFTPEPGPANVLQFNRILAAAGFRCNVQESAGVSCLSELTGEGFTFSDEGMLPVYTDVPADAP